MCAKSLKNAFASSQICSLNKLKYSLSLGYKVMFFRGSNLHRHQTIVQSQLNPAGTIEQNSAKIRGVYFNRGASSIRDLR